MVCRNDEIVPEVPATSLLLASALPTPGMVKFPLILLEGISPELQHGFLFLPRISL